MESTFLKWKVFVTPGIPTASKDLAPGETQRVRPPTSSTLIYGARDAVLVDPILTVKEAHTLARWVEASGKRLTTIYATHGHGDHCFGATTVLERFPGARFVATPGAVKVMRQQASPQSVGSFWNPRFPGQISDQLVIAEELADSVIELEGHELAIVEVGHTDTDNTTVLHVPELGLVAAGDVAYNGVHLHLVESNSETRLEWIAALDTIEAMKPGVVIAGHKRAENGDSAKIIEETRQYIRDFDRIAETRTTARELYDQILTVSESD